MELVAGKTYRAKRPKVNLRGVYNDRTINSIEGDCVYWDGLTANGGAYMPVCSVRTFTKWAGEIIEPITDEERWMKTFELSESQRRWLRLLWGLDKGCADNERYAYPYPSNEELNELATKGLTLLDAPMGEEEHFITKRGIRWLTRNKLKPMVTG